MRVFRFDKKRNTLTIQVVIMIIIAFAMFVQFSLSNQVIFLVLMALSVAFLGIYLYRIFFMRIIFEDNYVVYKGFSKRYTINKENIYCVNIIKRKANDVEITEYKKGDIVPSFPDKAFVMIKQNDKVQSPNISMFSAANDDYISLEYVKGLEIYLNKLLH